MNVQSASGKSHSRLPELSPFDAEKSGLPPVTSIRADGDSQNNADVACSAESAYGCVEWFRYPELPGQRRLSGAP
ncbi:MAG TPA: hypothetical protein VNX02_00380 [Steroidobacteraceae bacterium]|jgi:hypothetical protein|nr:hypothetical protein [Steroidobacteraceae bacterium]